MNKPNKPRFSSLREFSWSGSREREADEAFIESAILEWHDQKHRKPSPEEIAFVNSMPIRGCPFCGSRVTVRYGKDGNGIQRHKCLRCEGRFNPLTGTIFDSRKIPISEWVGFLLHLFEYHSIKTSANDNRNAETTGKYWFSKAFAVLKASKGTSSLNG